MKGFLTCSVLAAALTFGAGTLVAVPTLDGVISGGESYVHLTEDPWAQPESGGLTTASDFTAETSSQHRWDGIGGVDVDIGTMDNGQGRAATWNMFISFDYQNLYLGIEGGSLTFNNWSGPNGGSSDDDGVQGDFYIAIDASKDIPNGSEFLTANDGHRSFHDVGLPQAVDFTGWRPTHIIGVDWVDNSSFSDGYGNIEETGTHLVLGGEQPGLNNGGFDWAVNYSTFATYEFRIPWTMLGVTSADISNSFHFATAMYTTFNDDQHDTFDTGPGFGQTTTFEEIGDFPGDLDTGSGDDGLFAGVAASNGVPAGSFPGSNYVDPGSPNNDYAATPNTGDEIDTIGEYMLFVIPEPGTFSLFVLGLGSLAAVRRKFRA